MHNRQCKNAFSQQIHVKEHLFLIDDVTNCADVSSSAVCSCDSKVGKMLGTIYSLAIWQLEDNTDAKYLTF